MVGYPIPRAQERTVLSISIPVASVPQPTQQSFLRALVKGAPFDSLDLIIAAGSELALKIATGSPHFNFNAMLSTTSRFFLRGGKT